MFDSTNCIYSTRVQYIHSDRELQNRIPRSTISKIESGKRNICFDKLVQIAEALGKDLEIRFVDKEK
jgi:transcriptional regulator with XRE-family HTH domain